MSLYLDTGHGKDNTRRGVYDPGAVSAGVREADVVRELAGEVLGRLQAAGVACQMAPEGLLGARCRWQRRTLTAEDVLLSLHMNAGGGTGTEVLYSSDRSELRQRAATLSALVAAGLNLRDRGAKTDIEAHGGALGILRASLAMSFLLEVAFIDSQSDRLAVFMRGGEVIADAIVEAFR